MSNEAEIRHKIQKGEIDINNQEPFFKNMIKALVLKLNRDFTCRGISIPHYMLNTGDDIMYLENKGQDQSIEPYEVSNENFIYTTVPRCMISLGGLDFLGDQLTSPYSQGQFQYKDQDYLIEFTAEFRRMPFKLSVELKYCFDTMTDVFEYIQEVFSRALTVQTFQFQYLGQAITCSYQVPTTYSTEVNMTFDSYTTDSKTRNVSLSIEIEGNFPYFHPKTAAEKNITITVYANDMRLPMDESTRIEPNQKRENTAEVDKLKVLYNEGIPLADALEPDLYEKVIEEDGTREG